MGLNSESSSSEATPSPANTVAPVISGTLEIDSILTVSNGTWTGSPTSYTYQWKRNGSNIPGETSSTYSTKNDDGGQTITCTVTAVNAAGSASSTSAGVVITTQFPFTIYNDMALWLDSSNTKTMFTASATQAAVSEATSGNVGLMYDRSLNAHVVRVAPFGGSVNNCPSTSNDGTRNALVFNQGNNNRIQLVRVQSALKAIHSANPVCSIMFYMRMTTGNASQRVVMSNNNNLTTQIGFSIYRDASNKVVARATNGSAVTWTITSTTSITTASLWVPVIITLNGSGTGTGRLIISTLEDVTFDIPATGVSSNATGDLWIGTRSSLVEFFAGNLSDLIILNRVATSGEIASFKAYNPTRKSVDYTPILHTWYDFTDATKMYSDTSATINVVANDPIRVVKNKVSENFSENGRRLTTVDVPTSPLYKTNVQNGFSAVEWDGNGDNFDIETELCTEYGGQFVLVFIAKNRDSVNGSHLARGGSRYVVLTGKDYDGTSPRMQWHPDPTDSDSVGIHGKGSGANVWEMFVIRRNGPVTTVWNGLKQSAATTTDHPFSLVDIGIDDFPSAEWDMDGNQLLIKKWTGYMNDVEVEAMIDSFNTLYGI